MTKFHNLRDALKVCTQDRCRPDQS